jgi:hypothetical protein
MTVELAGAILVKVGVVVIQVLRKKRILLKRKKLLKSQYN